MVRVKSLLKRNNTRNTRIVKGAIDNTQHVSSSTGLIDADDRIMTLSYGAETRSRGRDHFVRTGIRFKCWINHVSVSAEESSKNP
jgi:hypothetical protein